MNTTQTQTMPPPGSMTTNSSDTMDTEYHMTLLVTYSVVLICGIVSLSLMIHILRSSPLSTTSTAVLNLIFAHFVFLVTVPFRIYYYATGEWKLSPEWCKMVSAMIHIHMYMSFLMYVIILLTRLLPHYYKSMRVMSFNRMYAVITSVVIWGAVFIAVPFSVIHLYGKEHGNSEQCFKFGHEMESIKGLNYFLSAFMIVVAMVLIGLQANVLRVLYRKDRQRCSGQQEFAAQLKSLCFAMIMLVCFVPYHIFRFFYINECEKLENINEVFLSLTTLNCLDMLTFLGRRSCNSCFPSRYV